MQGAFLGQRFAALCGILLIVFVGHWAHAALIEGKQYKRLAIPQGQMHAGKMEVIEFFWYGCPHCYWLEPTLTQWEATLPKDVVFRRVHIAWPGRTDIDEHAKLFATLQLMGSESKYRKAIFEAIQNQHIELRKEPVLFDWIKKNGIDLDAFKANYYSFTANAIFNKLSQMTQTYRIDSVPVFVVNGKYFTDTTMAGDQQASIIQVINGLLDMERKTKREVVPSRKK